VLKPVPPRHFPRLEGVSRVLVGHQPIPKRQHDYADERDEGQHPEAPVPAADSTLAVDLTVGEYFPLEVRASAIAWFYAIGTALGGIAGPIGFGHLIASGERGEVFMGMPSEEA